MLIGRLILDNIARDRNIIQVFTVRDRVLLLELTQPIFTYIKQTYQAQQFHFHPPSVSSFLRVQNPEKFGDDLSSFAMQIVGKKLAGTVAETNAAAKDAIQIIANLTAAGAGAEKSFVEVYESVNQISQQEEQIVNAMTERENTSREVLSAIRNINAVTGGVRDASAEGNRLHKKCSG